MNHILILLSAILIAGMTAPAYAQTISDHVVINEVDTNPFGDDSKSISEWVELYNPTDSDVDLTGWKIASTTVLKKTLAIPDGTIIGSDKLLKFTYDKIWFTDSSESVELRNSIDEVIDKTPSITDLKNDFFSWQRSYDGHSNWEFSLATAGGSNGKLSVSEDPSMIDITFSSDKSIYNFDETAIIGGTVSEKVFVEFPAFQPEPILINISGPNFEQAVSLYPDSNLRYETTLNLVQVLGIAEGDYDVTVNYAGVSANTSFSVVSEIIEIVDDVDSTFSVQTDQKEYSLDQSILLTGTASEVVPFESMDFTVIDPAGKQITNGSLFTIDGEFETSISINFATPVYGDYIVNAQYSEHVASTTFTLIENIVDVEDSVSSNIMILNLDDFEYLENDYIYISGLLPNFDSNNDIYYQVVYLDFYTSDGKLITFSGMTEDTSSRLGTVVPFTSTAVPNNSGEFSVDVRLPSTLFPEGVYEIKANYGGLKSSKTFSIVSERNSMSENSSIGSGNPNTSIPTKSSSNEEKDAGGYVVSNVKTIIEKVNRISDDLILINTQEKILDDQTVNPRVLSGSMMTISKDAQSTVNLQVSSESGICIIGQNSDCLVTESTRKPGQIFEVVQVDGLNLNVRYSGSDVRLEKFSILPESSDEFLPDTNWNVEVIKNNEISRMYYKVTYKTLQ
ncbi:lamin tail domain-containing protein [Nitrosopumilus sp.]|nr:lamin tail domain-containing protein [Nitrosopumilus sp.]